MKKFLSLVLALVMTMSLVTISAGAKDFTDADKVTYTEAVDVLSAVKVIDGYTDGAFKPTTQLNRGQAAKILCNMILGPTTASALKADAAPFKDVAADNTFAAYIAYCAKEGIIDGYTDGTFRPTAPLTGYAFMKLLLGALGYDKDVEGYNGGNWSINVAKRALAIGLDDGLVAEFDGTKIVTREEACLFALNTLKADMVEYDAKTNISVGGAEVVIAGSKAKEVANNAKTETIFEDDTMQFAEKYFTNLKLNDAARDDFARPSNQWKVKAETIGTYSQTPDLTYTKKVKSGAIYADLGLGSKIESKNVKVYVDGVPVTNNVALVKGGETGLGVDGDSIGNGVLTEVFYDDKADTVEVIQINTYVGTVAKSVKATDAKDAYIVIAPEAVRPAGGNKEFETDEVFEDDAVVLYTYSKQGTGAVKSVVVAESVEGTVTESQNKVIDGEKSQSVAIDGETYKTALKFTGEEVGNITVKGDYKVYLDEYGYMIKIEEVENLSSEYALVLALRGSNSFDSNRAKLLFGDGTEKVVDTAKDYTKASNKVNQWDIVSYKVEDGVYTLKSVPAAKQVSAANQGLNDFVLINSKAAVTVNGTAAKLMTNSNTTFVVKDVADDEINAYTGVKAVPTIKTTASVTADVYAYSKNAMATIVFVLADNDAIIEDENNKSLYLSSASVSNLIHDNTGDYFTYNAIVNGEITTVKVDEDTVSNGVTAKNLKGMFNSYSTDSKSVITKVNAYANTFSTGASKEYLSGTGISKTSADYTVTLGTKAGPNATLTVDDNAKIFYVDKDGKISESSYSAIAVDDNDVVYAYVDEYLVKTLVIEEVKDGVVDTGTGTGRTENFTWDAKVFSNGVARVTVTANRPEYIDNSTALSYSYDVYVNGALYDTVSSSLTSEDIAISSDTATSIWTNSMWMPLDPSDVVTVKNLQFTNLTAQSYKLKIVDKNGKDLKDQLSKPIASGWVIPASTTTSKAVQFKSGLYSAGTFDIVKVENATYTGTLPTGTAHSTGANIIALKADTKGYVVITVDTTNLTAAPVTYDITSETAALTNGTGVALSTFGVSGTEAGNKLKITADTANSYSLTGNAAGESVRLQVALGSAVNSATYSVDVTVKVGGKTLTKTGVTNSAADLGYVTMNGDYEIKDADVTVTVTPKLKATSVTHTIGSFEYVINFNRKLADANTTAGISVSVDDATNGVVSATIVGKTLVVKLANELATGKTITVAANELVDADYAGNDNSAAINCKVAVSGTPATETWTIS